MQSTDELVNELAKLPKRNYLEVLKKAEKQRLVAVGESEPSPGMDKEAFARWIGHQHYLIDPGVVHVYYLPGESPDNEVRLIEVNELGRLPETGPIVAVDFMPDVDGIDYTLIVADVTPAQWEAVIRHGIDLPEGWTLDGMMQVAPTDP